MNAADSQFAEQIDREGYVAISDFFDAAFCRDLLERVNELFEAEGDSAGSEFRTEEGARRLANLVNKGEIFRRVIADPRLLSFVGSVLGEYKLSSLNARSTIPGAGVTQPLHADMGAVPDEVGYWVCNALWMLTDITLENGPLRIIPRTHRFGRLPQNDIDDLTAPHPDEVMVTGSAGTVVIMNAHCWHGGMPNRSSGPRVALHAFYVRRDHPQQQYQRQLLDSPVQDGLSAELRSLLALDDPENDRLSKDPASRSGFLK